MPVGVYLQRFEVLVRAVKPSDAVEKVLSEAAAIHKVRRHLVKIESVEEVSDEELAKIGDERITALMAMDRVIRYR